MRFRSKQTNFHAQNFHVVLTDITINIVKTIRPIDKHLYYDAIFTMMSQGVMILFTSHIMADNFLKLCLVFFDKHVVHSPHHLIDMYDTIHARMRA